MPMHPRTASPRRPRRIENAARALALLASVSLLACEQTDSVETREAEPNARPGEPVTRQAPEPDSENTAMRTPPGDEERLAGRLGQPQRDMPMGQQPDPTRSDPTRAPTTPGMEATGEPKGEPEPIEKTASLSMQDFERRFESELGEQDLTLASSFDLPQDPQMKMFVIAPKELDTGTAARPGEMPPPGSGAMQDPSAPAQPGTMGGPGTTPEGGAPPSDAAGGTTPPPQPGAMQGGAGDSPTQPAQPSSPTDTKSGTAQAGDKGSKQAKMALQKSRLVVAYTDPSRPDQVTIAYIDEASAQAGQIDQKLQSAIDAATGSEMGTPPPTGTPPGEDRRG